MARDGFSFSRYGSGLLANSLTCLINSEKRLLVAPCGVERGRYNGEEKPAGLRRLRPALQVVH